MSEIKLPVYDIHWACAHVLGDKLAHDITMDMGIHWARVAALAAAHTSDSPHALKILKEWNARTPEPK